MPKWTIAALMGATFSGGHCTSRFPDFARLGATFGSSPLSSLTWAIQHVFGTNPDFFFTHCWIAA